MAEQQEIIDGPDAVFTSKECDTFRWRIRHAGREQSVYVEIGWALISEVLEEPLLAAVESKGEVPLLELMRAGIVPARIRMTAAGLFAVDADGREEPI